MSGVEDTGAPSRDGLSSDDGAASVSAPSGFDPSRISEAVALVEASQLQPIIRKAAEEFYEAVLGSAEDYLRDNLDWNLKAHLSMLERENQRMRTELWEVDKIVGPSSERIGRLRELDRAQAELVTLKFAQAMSAGTAEPAMQSQGNSPPARSGGCAQ